jgi:hypothetical protein
MATVIWVLPKNGRTVQNAAQIPHPAQASGESGGPLDRGTDHAEICRVDEMPASPFSLDDGRIGQIDLGSGEVVGRGLDVL